MTSPSKPLDVDTLNYVIDLLKRNWYDLNNLETPANEDLRNLGIRVGRKTQLINNINDLVDIRNANTQI